jgi:hypothetical protein
MKAPKLADLQSVQNGNDFTAAVEAAKQRASGVIRKTYSLEQRHEDHINAMAASMSQARGKPVNASEALRAIINRDMEREGQ